MAAGNERRLIGGRTLRGWCDWNYAGNFVIRGGGPGFAQHIILEREHALLAGGDQSTAVRPIGCRGPALNGWKDPGVFALNLSRDRIADAFEAAVHQEVPPAS